MNEHNTKWLTFNRIYIPNRITQTWQVVSKRGVLLGTIKWFSHWRQYAFFPHEGSLFNSECLNDIKDFIDGLMKRRK